MNGQYYQVSNVGCTYKRRWTTKYQRRIFTIWNTILAPDGFKAQINPAIGFEEKYEYGYCLGVF